MYILDCLITKLRLAGFGGEVVRPNLLLEENS